MKPNTDKATPLEDVLDSLECFSKRAKSAPQEACDCWRCESARALIAEYSRLKAIERAAIRLCDRALGDKALMKTEDALRSALEDTPKVVRERAAREQAERKALEAVAEAAKEIDNTSPISPKESNYAYRQRILEPIRQALANLAAIRGKK